jgi:hypothetical protein
MKRSMIVVATVMVVMLAASAAQADPTWYTIRFTGTDMFNYTTTVAPRADQDAPRRYRDWMNEDITMEVRSDGDANSNGTNDFAEWAQGTPGLAGFGFSYFNLWGETIGASSWNQPYHAVPDQHDGKYGAESWRNQMVNGVPVHAGMGSPGVWDGGIVLANQSYNPSDYAFPVWRAPTGTQLTMENAASLVFSVDVLIENYDTAFESNGKLRVWFGGFNEPQDTPGAAGEIAGVMLTPEPATMALLAAGGIGMLLRRRRGQ